LFYTHNLVPNTLAIKVQGHRVTNLGSLKILPYYLQSPTIWDQEVNTRLFNYEYNQQDALYRLIYYSKSDLHVSGGVFAHNQEHLAVFTVSGSVHPCCCRLHASALLAR